MERNELMEDEGVNRLRAERFSPHRPDCESRRLPDDRMLWKWTALMRFEPFPTLSSVSSNAAELRLQSHHVVGSPMENRNLMTRRGGASKLPYLDEGRGTPQGGTPRMPQASGPAVAEFKYGTPTNLQRRGVTGV
jgi:hypothetical protein